ncbi:hypothetical protein EVAR_10854_1 [Eumeta japonica]|uniref:C2H2-type domain-containing protein n=1 Tax=Eumeta variegata TaxID=151549 RepID=A0A4C1URG0_EUMVA|nr:hypothetical protein EVAR_10854_1 [Eumeta japonica]
MNSIETLDIQDIRKITNFNRVCRACLTNEEPLKELFANCSVEVFKYCTSIEGDLDKHMKSHYDEKPFACEICDKSFKTKSFLSIHMRTHTGERPYACDLCPMKFMCRKDLRNHRMTHTGEKPHKCQLCNQAFIQKCALNRHMKSHLKQCAADQENIIIQRTEQLHTVEEVAPITVSYSEWQPVA